MPEVSRCDWVPLDDELYAEYHDREWGTPVHDDHVLFEFLLLEGAQAGLSWRTILARRDGYRRAFASFDAASVAQYTPADEARLMDDASIIRNRLKISSAVSNAKAFLTVQAEESSFANYLWAFTDGEVIVTRESSSGQLPTQTALSNTISKDLKRRGFRFVGPTIVYAYLQAVGVLDDHTAECFRA